MRSRLFLPLALLGIATPALADKLVFDHRIYQPLKDAFESGNADLIAYNDKNPAYVTDLVVVRGKSTKNWTEAMIIIARRPDAKVPAPAEWMAELQRQADAQCPSQFTVIAQDEGSITLERQSRGCPANYPQWALYRIVQGKPSLFLLGAMSKDGFTPEARKAWLALFASARLD
jgi:hypothetical protein